MKVKDVMTRNVCSCTPDTNLAVVAALMWENDCGIVPVVRPDGKVIGMITDRDICMAVATKNRLTSEVTVREVFTGNLYTCTPNEEVHDALTTMRAECVRRLPVISVDGALEGILSLNDIVLRLQDSTATGSPDVSQDDVIKTLKAIYGHPRAGRRLRADATVAP